MLQWDFLVAVVFGVLVAVLPGDRLVAERFTIVLSTEAAIGSGLLGLVLAGLALVVAFLNDDLILQLDSTGEGLAEDVWPFSLTAALAGVTTGVAVWFLAVASNTEVLWLRVGTGLSSFLFIWTLFSVLALVAQVFEYGKVRTAHIKASRPPGDK